MTIMLRNVEIKAKVEDLEEILRRAKQLSNSDGEIIPQHDIFFNVPNGRMKLRKLQDRAQLVFYDRPDEGGPKLSEYEIYNLPSSPGDPYSSSDYLQSVLTRSMGVKGQLKKTRTLFMVDQTRVHIDAVDGLGNFMELEVVLREDQSLEQGQAIANDLQRKLGVLDEELLSGAYIDMVLRGSK